MKYLLMLVTFLAVAVGSVVAQSPTVTYVDREKVATALANGGGLVTAPNLTVSGNHRAVPGQVEVHDKETDIFYVVDGEATFVTGGKMIGGKLARPNQWLGTSIEGGETRQLKKGDFIVIPAGVPHWFKEVPQSVNYYVVKSIRP